MKTDMHLFVGLILAWYDVTMRFVEKDSGSKLSLVTKDKSLLVAKLTC